MGGEPHAAESAQDGPRPTSQPQRWSRARASRRALTAGDVALGLALLMLFAFAPVAQWAADSEPDFPVADVPHARARLSGEAPRVRSLPAGLPDGLAVESPDDLLSLATAALGARNATRLLTLATNASPTLEDDLIWTLEWEGYRDIPQPSPPYPYRYPPLERLLDAAPPSFAEHAGALGAALLALAGQTVTDEDGLHAAYPEAAPIAFAVLHRAAVQPDCDARLNLLLLLTADTLPREEAVSQEAERAFAACPGDPTPHWLYAQYLSLRSQQRDVPDLLGDAVPPDAIHTATRVLESYLSDHPASPDILAALADVQVREAERTAVEQPFAARARLRGAEALYRRAMGHASGGSAEYTVGLARALHGLGENADAAAVLRGDAVVPSAGYVLELRIDAEEAAQQFTEASTTARRLHQLGPSAYPSDGALFPTPAFGASFDADDLDIPAVSVGVARFKPLSVTLQPSEGGGGGFVDDLSFLPEYRDDPGWTGVLGQCPAWAWRRDALLAGDAMAVWEGLPRELDFSDPLERCRSASSLGDHARATVAAEAGQEWRLGREASDQVYDRRQNLWRWAGDLDRAVGVIEEWRRAAGEEAPLPVARLAEVQFLQERYDESAASFASAVRRARQDDWDNAVRIFEFTLGHAAALLRADRKQEALEALRWVQPMAEQGAAYQREQGGYDEQFAALAFHASALLADTESEGGELEAALESYDAAEEMLGYLDEERATTTPVIGLREERLYGNRAIAELAAGRVEQAEVNIEKALAVDPMNAAFLMTAGFVADRAHERDAAIEHNRAAIESDPGAFAAANDLGVQLARAGRHDAALVALRQAVAAEPSYALGWFNLGVVHASMGPAHLLASQGALAKAIELDPDLAERRQVPTIDAQIYRTNLDLSKPLPPGWSFADLDRSAPAASAGLLAALLLALGVARSGGRDGGELVERWSNVATAATARVPLLARLRSPGWAVSLTVVLLTFAAARADRYSWWSLAGYLTGAAVLALVAVQVRALVGRTGGEGGVRQATWAPAVLLGIGVTAAGSVWAPMPVVEGTSRRVAVHAAAPVALGLVAVVLLFQAFWTDVSLTRAWGLAAVVMAASMLLPLPPHDGARLTGAGQLAGAVLVGATALLVLGLV